MIKVVDYDRETGHILRVITYWDEATALTVYPGCLLVPAETLVDDLTCVVIDGKVMPRPTNGETP